MAFTTSKMGKHRDSIIPTSGRAKRAYDARKQREMRVEQAEELCRSLSNAISAWGRRRKRVAGKARPGAAPHASVPNVEWIKADGRWKVTFKRFTKRVYCDSFNDFQDACDHRNFIAGELGMSIISQDVIERAMGREPKQSSPNKPRKPKKPKVKKKRQWENRKEFLPTPAQETKERNKAKIQADREIEYLRRIEAMKKREAERLAQWNASR